MGSKQQEMDVLFDTGSYHLLLYGHACDIPSEYEKYNYAESESKKRRYPKTTFTQVFVSTELRGRLIEVSLKLILGSSVFTHSKG